MDDRSGVPARDDAGDAVDPPRAEAASGEPLDELFHARLTELFDAEEVKRGRTVTSAEVAKWMTENGHPVQRAYVNALRKGTKTTPSWGIIEGLAKYFGVAREYFITDAEVTPMARAAKLEKALADKGVEMFALRAEGLSEESLQLVIAMVDRMRAAENLGEVDGSKA
ncbi:hypothetical protein ACFT2C_06275 [Promicromonospora sp. NPDC057138]|uniref:hypothetical protein n=1 Tax=Promicromonospora sp. NPDC057138 TaxID=3346031 RepID=UPI003644CA76